MIRQKGPRSINGLCRQLMRSSDNVAGVSLKGWQIVAGDRSEAQTTGQQSTKIPHPARVSEKSGTPSGVHKPEALLSGGLRFAATTGYFLAAFQAAFKLESSPYARASDTSFINSSMTFAARPEPPGSPILLMTSFNSARIARLRSGSSNEFNSSANVSPVKSS